MCRGGRTDLLLLQMAVSSSESEVMCWFWPISPVNDVTFTSVVRQNLAECNYVSSESCNRLSNNLTVLCLFHKKMQVVSAPSPDVLKEHELSSMTTYSVPKISFSSVSFEINTEKLLDLLLMAYIPVCGWRMSRSLPFPCLSSVASLCSSSSTFINSRQLTRQPLDM